MIVDITLVSYDKEIDVENISNLKKRFEENFDDITIKQHQEAVKPDDAAVGILSSLLNVVIGKEFLNGIIETFKEWIKSRPSVLEAKKSKLKISVDGANGKKVVIEVENIKDLERLKELSDSLVK